MVYFGKTKYQENNPVFVMHHLSIPTTLPVMVYFGKTKYQENNPVFATHNLSIPTTLPKPPYPPRQEEYAVVLCWVCWAIVMTLLQIVLSFVSSYSVLRYVLHPVPVIFNRPPSDLPQVRSCPPEPAHSLRGTGCLGGNCYGQDIQVPNNNF